MNGITEVGIIYTKESFAVEYHQKPDPHDLKSTGFLVKAVLIDSSFFYLGAIA